MDAFLDAVTLEKLKLFARVEGAEDLNWRVSCVIKPWTQIFRCPFIIVFYDTIHISRDESLFL